MPKLKTRRAVAKRVRLTSSGKLKRDHAFAGHNLTKKSAKRKRNLRKSDLINKADQARIRKMLGV